MQLTREGENVADKKPVGNVKAPRLNLEKKWLSFRPITYILVIEISMHSSNYQSVTFHHDGDADGCMYLVDSQGTEIVTTLQTLFAAIGAQPDGASVTITGPDAAVHDRFEVTKPTYREITPGPWTFCTVQIARTDLEGFLVFAKSRALEDAVNAIDLAEVPYAAAIERLDRAIAAVTALSPQKNGES
jgi:hypothetical protein